MYLLGIDLGTTGCKSLVLSPDGTVLGEHYIEYNLIFTTEGVEQDADEWWRHVQDAVKAAISQASVDGRKIVALAISSQGISFVPLDRQGNTLMNALSWYDSRSRAEADQLRRDPACADLSRRTGRCVVPMVFPQMMWLKKHRPEIYQKTWKFLMGLDYLQYRFCGAAVTDYSMASGTLCYDVATQTWISELFEQYAIDQDKMPEIACFGKVIGTVLPEVARHLGLSEQTKVVLGLQDQKCAALGAGIRNGVITISLGTASAISSLTAERRFDPEERVFCHGFDQSRFILESSVPTAGAALRWVRNTFFPNLSYPQMDELAAAAPPGGNGLFFHPLLTPGARLNQNGQLTGFSLNTSRSDVIRAVLEGVSFEIAERITAHRQINSQVAPAGELHVFGGGAASAIWCQILADVTGLDVRVPSSRETAGMGAALCAGIGSRLYADMEQAQAACAMTWKTYKPQADNQQTYRSIMKTYMAMRHERKKWSDFTC
ncbi:MAG: hypothetical protein GX173_03575 [Ruminococcaceae bacterium]|nr:hypothetical protein [Oscillospiraceae bacterium]